MTKGQDQKEDAVQRPDAADLSSVNKAVVSPKVNVEGEISSEVSQGEGSTPTSALVGDSGDIKNEDEKIVGETDYEGAEPSEKQNEEESSESANQDLKIPEILPLAGAREEGNTDSQEKDSEGEDERVWGNQVGGHVDREQISGQPVGSSFDVSQISVKKSELGKRKHSGFRRATSWILGLVSVVVVIGLALYASGLWQKIFTSEGASSPQEGTKAYLGALLDKDAQGLCALFAPQARKEILGKAAKKPEGNSLEQCTDYMKEQLAMSPGNPKAKLDDFRYAPDRKVDVGKVKAILIKDKKGTPLQAVGWLQVDGRWYLAGPQAQQQVMMKYYQAQGAQGKAKK